jgi:hypothetical protein
MRSDRQAFRLAWAWALAFAVLRLWFVSQIDLSEDEAYYWEWSRSLDIGYYVSELGVRAAAVLGALAISGMAIWACGAMGLMALAPWTVLAFNGMLLFSVGAVMMMHDSLLGLFWMAALGAALQAQKDPRWWLAAGLAAGLGFLSKYTGVLLFVCLGIFALARREERHRVGRSAWFWAGGLLGSLAAVPVLVWNSRHGWITLTHTAGLAGNDAARRDPRAILDFIGSQFGLVTPVLMGMMLLAWAWVWRRRREASYQHWLLLCLSMPVAAFFLLLSLRSRIEANWPSPAYLGAVLLVSAWLAGPAAGRKRLAAWALGVAFFFSAVTHIQAVRPFIPFPQKAAKADVVARVDGWRELGQRVQAERVAMGGSPFVGARTYQNCAALGFYVTGRERVLMVKEGRGDRQYLIWNEPDRYLGRDAVLVAGQEWELGEMAAQFERIEHLPDQVFVRNGIEVRRSRLMRGYNFKGQP